MMQAQAAHSATRDRRGISLLDRIIGAIDCSPWSAHTAASGRYRNRSDPGPAAPDYSGHTLTAGAPHTAALSGATD